MDKTTYQGIIRNNRLLIIDDSFNIELLGGTQTHLGTVQVSELKYGLLIMQIFTESAAVVIEEDGTVTKNATHIPSDELYSLLDSLTPVMIE